MQSPSDANGGLSSLAEELESAEGGTENEKRLQAEVKKLTEANKALTLYMDKFLSKIMANEGAEALFEKKAGNSPSAQDPPPRAGPSPAGGDQAAVPSFLKRMSSVARRRPLSQITVLSSPVSEEPGGAQSRPASQLVPPNSARLAPTTANENPATAPSIPIGRSVSVSARARGHRHTQSTQSQSGEQSSGLGTSPSPHQPVDISSPLLTPRTSSFMSNPMTGSRSTSASNVPTTLSEKPQSSSGTSVASHEHAEVGNSPPRTREGNTNYTGAVMTQKGLRPLRLAQQASDVAAEEEAARKRANRASWMGWFNKGEQGRSISGGSVPTLNESAGS